jgi:hypothetical protein
MIGIATYLSCNALFAICVVVVAALTESSIHPLYLIPLVAMCAAPLLYMRKLNDRFALLGVFFLFYFFWFGNMDVLRLLGLAEAPKEPQGGVLDAAEAAILLGGLLIQGAYLLVCAVRRPPAADRIREWPESLLVAGGVAIWLITTVMTWQFKVYIIKDATMDSISRGLGGLSGFQTDLFMFATYLQPASLMMLAYGYCKYRRGYMVPIVGTMVVAQFILGFVDDGKGEALSGVLMLIVTKFLVDGRVPKTWLVAGVAMIALTFPLLQANRAVRHARELTHDAAAADLGSAFEQAIAAEKPEDRSSQRPNEHRESIFERTWLKDTVEIMFARLGHGAEFRGGDTLEPLLTFFIPRSLWPEKPNVMVGLLVTKVFFPEQTGEVNLSDSQLGELYWNFGWTGILVGMSCIGCILGLVGFGCDLSRSVTLTRVIVLGVTIQLIVIGFESGITTQYSEWFRMMGAIGVLHLCFARRPRADVGPAPAAARGNADGAPLSPAIAPLSPAIAARYPNLVR